MLFSKWARKYIWSGNPQSSTSPFQSYTASFTEVTKFPRRIHFFSSILALLINLGLQSITLTIILMKYCNMEILLVSDEE